MKRVPRDIRLLVVLLLASVILVVPERIIMVRTERPDARQMEHARDLADHWMSLVDQEKQKRGIKNELDSSIPHPHLLGNEFTQVTTTLGSPAAKELSTNPEFAALVVRLLHTAGIPSAGRVGIMLSGSFPAVGISTLAALQTLGLEVKLISSLGASSYGANQAGALWIDYERWLVKRGGLQYTSDLVTYGGEDDNGSSIYSAGLTILDSTLDSYNIVPYVPQSLMESVTHKFHLLRKNEIDVLINIGGNQSSLGSCSHSLMIPPGLNQTLPSCEHDRRGLIQEFIAAGVPVIQLLNIRELALQYGIKHPLNTMGDKPELLYNNYRFRKGLLVLFIILLVLGVWWIGRCGKNNIR